MASRGVKKSRDILGGPSDVPVEVWKMKMLLFLQGLDKDVEYGAFPPKPDWFDQEKFNRGREFFREHSLAIILSHMVFLTLGMCIQRFVRVLVMTGKSSTPEDALDRYRKTGEYLAAWYDGPDPWDVNSLSHKAIVSVRKMHKAASSMLNEKRPAGIGAKQPVATEEYEMRAKKTLDDIRSDVADSVRVLDEKFAEKVSSSRTIDETQCRNLTKLLFAAQILDLSDQKYREFPRITQFDMGLTQLGFTGGMLLCPDHFGICSSSPEVRAGLDSFCFFWRTIAYCLGVEEEFNLCSGSYPDARDRAKLMTELYLKPLTKRLEISSVYMSDAVALGYQKMSSIFPSAKVLLYYGTQCPGVDIQLKRIYRSFTWVETFQYGLLKFVFGFLLRHKITKRCLQCLFGILIRFVRWRRARVSAASSE